MSQFHHAVVSHEAKQMDETLQKLGGSAAARVGSAEVFVRVCPAVPSDEADGMGDVVDGIGPGPPGAVKRP